MTLDPKSLIYWLGQHCEADQGVQLKPTAIVFVNPLLKYIQQQTKLTNDEIDTLYVAGQQNKSYD